MKYKLGTNVKKGEKILLKTGWKKIIEIDQEGVTIEGGNRMDYGWEIYGWKAK